jgi:membrane-bound metal-dependent hydrolase YbcI (DUF457 family)
MTPVGHVAIGVVVGHAARRPWAPLVAAIGAALPDVDFVLVWSSHFNEWHRVITHNLAFVTLAALALAWPLARRFAMQPLAVATLLFLGSLSHLLVDACLDSNASNGIGIAMLWPFDTRMVSPFNLVAPSTDPRGWNDPTSALTAAAHGVAWELPWILLATIMLWLRRRRSARR